VSQEADVTRVIFYTFTRLGTERGVRPCDTFRAGRLVFQSRSDVIAVGGPDYVF
jgi:hypothetical protein